MAARRTRNHKVRSAGGLTSLWLDILCALLLPALFLAAYGGLWVMDVFSVLYGFLHVAAFILTLLWAVMAYHGAKGFWSTKIDLSFGLVIAILTGLGACWGGYHAVPVKAWVMAPTYARIPSVQLEEPMHGRMYRVIEGSTIHISWQDEGESPVVRFAGREEKLESAVGLDLSSTFTAPSVEKETVVSLVMRRGWKRLAVWTMLVVPDAAPQVALTEDPEITARKTIRFAYRATDDFGVEQIAVRIAPTSSSTGLSTEPVELQIATPAIKDVETASYVDMTSLPWAGVPVTVQLVATDGAGHRGWSKPKILTLPRRAFHNPFARALIEERQKFLGQPDTVTRDEAANVMAGIARQQSLSHGDPVAMMALRAGAVRLVLNEDPETISAIGDILWKTALRLEEGPLGQVRAELADSERDLAYAILRELSIEYVRPYLTHVRATMEKYFEALELERARQPPALQELDWPLATASEMLTPEDLQGRLATVGDQVNTGAYSEARETLSQLQSLIENLRTTPPELTPQQAQLAQHVSALRALVRGQKNLIDETARLGSGEKGMDVKARKARRDDVTRTLTQQQLLLSALHDVTGRQGLDMQEAKISEGLLQQALFALQNKALSEAQKDQEEALSLLEKCMSKLTDQMRRSMTAKAP